MPQPLLLTEVGTVLLQSYLSTVYESAAIIPQQSEQFNVIHVSGEGLQSNDFHRVD